MRLTEAGTPLPRRCRFSSPSTSSASGRCLPESRPKAERFTPVGCSVAEPVGREELCTTVEPVYGTSAALTLEPGFRLCTELEFCGLSMAFGSTNGARVWGDEAGTPI